MRVKLGAKLSPFCFRALWMPKWMAGAGHRSGKDAMFSAAKPMPSTCLQTPASASEQILSLNWLSGQSQPRRAANQPS